jgi:hypothetical protein
MVDLFADVEPGSELFEQFSFISAEHLPEYRTLLARSESGKTDVLEPGDRGLLLAIAFRLFVARHRLGVIDEAFQQRLLGAWETFARGVCPLSSFLSATATTDWFQFRTIFCSGGLPLEEREPQWQSAT